MKYFEIVNYNWDEQRLDIRVKPPIHDGYFIVKDIDLDTTVYKFRLKDMDFDLNAFMIPTPRHGFDFQREDFGGFTFELIDGDVVLQREFLRFRHTNLDQYKQNINDFYHPVFVNYREFFVYDRYKNFNLTNCTNVIDLGASVGLFTRYMLNKGAQNVAAVECDERSIIALNSNFIGNNRVQVIPKAISDSEGEKALYWREDNPLINSLDIEGSEFSTEENPSFKMVQTTTLSNLIESLNWGPIDLLKVDIEGSEWDVFDSTPDYIFSQIDKVLLEYHWPKGRLQPTIDRFLSLGFNYVFEEGYNGTEENGTVFFFK